MSILLKKICFFNYMIFLKSIGIADQKLRQIYSVLSLNKYKTSKFFLDLTIFISNLFKNLIR